MWCASRWAARSGNATASPTWTAWRKSFLVEANAQNFDRLWRLLFPDAKERPYFAAGSGREKPASERTLRPLSEAR